jgi:hypothetical protein
LGVRDEAVVEPRELGAPLVELLLTTASRGELAARQLTAGDLAPISDTNDATHGGEEELP